MLTTAEIDAMRAEHRDIGGVCESCWYPESFENFDHVAFPCVPAKLLQELDRREAQHRWQGRDHLSPVPHLAGVAYGLLGPSLAEELPQREA